jgi:hypothetical protein
MALRNRHGNFLQAPRWSVLFAALAFLATGVASAQKQGPDDIPDRVVTNQDVIEMQNSGMTPLAIISRIHNSPCKFDKSAEGLEALKGAKVPYNVVLAMMKAPEIPAATKGRIPLVIPDSTPIKIGLSDDLDSNVQQPGFTIYFEVLEEVRIRGLRVIAKGARVRGRLLGSKDRSKSGEAARLDWGLTDVESVDGQRVPLRGGGSVIGEELQPEKNVTASKGEEFTAFTYGTRKVNVLEPLPPPRKAETSSPPMP